MNIFRTRYRVVTDAYLGFQADYRYWWMPFYMQVKGTNTWYSLEEALVFLSKAQYKVVWRDSDDNT